MFFEEGRDKMVSNSNKRLNYEYENLVSTSDEESIEDIDVDYMPNNNIRLKHKGKFELSTNICKFQDEFGIKKCDARSGRKPKCFTKNALLARKNRLKKKIYITNLEKDVNVLENENKKLVAIVENQSFLITDLRKQLKYLKSVIANSDDISKLIRNIHHSTGMSVSSSLDKNLSLKNVCVPKLEKPIARKTAHPWEELNQVQCATPHSNCLSSPIPPDALNENDLSGTLNDFPLQFPIELSEEELMGNFPFNDSVFSTDPPKATLNEHNYTTTMVENYEETVNDVGVCIHVSKHRLSLEFCSSCSENAAQSWLD